MPRKERKRTLHQSQLSIVTVSANQSSVSPALQRVAAVHEADGDCAGRHGHGDRAPLLPVRVLHHLQQGSCIEVINSYQL